MGCFKSKGTKPTQEHNEQHRDDNVASAGQLETSPSQKKKKKGKHPKTKDGQTTGRATRSLDRTGASQASQTTEESELENLRVQLKRKDEQLEDKDKELKELKDKTKKIIEFLEACSYRVDVGLDPNTAHPRLEVSQDGKCVRDTGSVLKVQNSEERFDSHMFVLAKDGLVKGRHYWEVEVGQKKNWDLGVASESIFRKGRITLAPQNGYWVIGLDGKENYWARTDPWTRLDVSGKPTKIGMFLNISKKILSFFDVNRRSKLHTYTLSCSGKKLYPFFSMGSVTTEPDSLPLKIPPWLEEDTIEEHKEQEEDNIEGHEVSE